MFNKFYCTGLIEFSFLSDNEVGVICRSNSKFVSKGTYNSFIDFSTIENSLKRRGRIFVWTNLQIAVICLICVRCQQQRRISLFRCKRCKSPITFFWCVFIITECPQIRNKMFTYFDRLEAGARRVSCCVPN